MSGETDLGFRSYVEGRRRAAYGGTEGARYAYGADLAMLRTFRRMRPVELAAASVVRAYKDVLSNQLLGTMTRVGPRQFPTMHRIATRCAERLGVPAPTLYVANSPFINAYTFGTDEEAFIVVHSALVDHFDETELEFVIGHETGHVQNKHVVYGTVLQAMKTTAAALLKIVLPPVEVALHAWSRRAEITCDRAGLLCCGDLDAATRSFVKLACGSHKLYGEIDVAAYREQYEDGRSSVGRFTEAFASHPYLPKRIRALEVFAESALYREATGTGEGGLTMEEVDRRTSELLRILGSSEAGPDAEAKR